ncbi:phosphotransferase [Phytomonospora sp. NPDC050363]|uniref:phosphotransferase family protein n=1 Tax=Phytomonospora sp. NPDC050363 TaxID=3155642 RepID=UPI0033C17BAB
MSSGIAVPYDKTAERPGAESLPAEVRAAVERELGGPIVSAPPAGGGFTGGFAAVVTAADGRSLFVKAAGPDKPHVASSYRREAEINVALPAGLPAPKMLFAESAGDWIVLGFEPVTGRAPTLPMAPADLDVMLAAWADAAERLAPVPQALRAAGIRTLAEDAGDQFHNFTRAAAGEAPLHRAVSPRHLGELAELELGVYPAVAADAVTHGDLRPDNMILTASGAMICDWNWPSIAAPWFDTVFLLITAHGDGHDADRLFFAHPTAVGVTGEQLDSVLAAAAGYYLDRAQQNPIPGVSSYLRRHQAWCGEAALAWLAARRGW